MTRTAGPLSQATGLELLGKKQVEASCRLCFASTYAMLPPTTSSDQDQETTKRLRDSQDQETSRRLEGLHQETTRTLPK